MKKTIGIVVGILILVAIFGLGVLRFSFAVNDKSIDLEIGKTSASNTLAPGIVN